MVKRTPLTRRPPPAPPRPPAPPGSSSLHPTLPTSWHAYAVPAHQEAAVSVDWLARAYDVGVRKELEDYAFASGRRAAAAAIQAQEIAARMRLAYAAGYGDGFHAVLPSRPVTMVPLNQRPVSALVRAKYRAGFANGYDDAMRTIQAEEECKCFDAYRL
jgi:hypothetical protein